MIILVILVLIVLAFFVTFNIDNNKSRESLINLNDIESIEYVSIVRSKQKTTGYKGRGIHKMPDSSNFIYKVNIVINTSLRDFATVYQNEDFEYIMGKAIEIKDHFNCRIYDCSTPNKNG